MKHPEAKELLSAYMDGELDPARASAVKKHIEVCKECAAHLESLRDLDQSVRLAGPEMPAEGYFEFFPSKVLARIRSRPAAVERGERMQLRLAWVRAAATAVVVLMAFGMGFFYGHRETGIRSPRPALVPLETMDSRRAEEPAAAGAERAAAGERTAEGAGRATPLQAAPEEKVVVDMDRAKKGAASKDERIGRTYEAQPGKPGEGMESEAVETSVVTGKQASRGREAPEPPVLSMPVSVVEKDERAAEAAKFYATANLAQLERDYDKALMDYAKVLELSPGTELASAARFQMNVVTVGSDTTADTEKLREKARAWEDWIREYPGSELTLAACDHYTQALYLVAKKTKSRVDAEKALSAIENCTSLLKEKMPTDFQKRAEELKEYIKG